MTYFPDLSPHRFESDPQNRPAWMDVFEFPESKPTLNVGWMSPKMPFPQGETTEEFQQRLLRFCLDRVVVNLTFGFQICEFCYPDGVVNISEWEKRDDGDLPSNSRCLLLGNGEIRVIGENAVFAAPVLIYHYVLKHNYKPPQEFIEAVMTGPRAGSEEHLRLVDELR